MKIILRFVFLKFNIYFTLFYFLSFGIESDRFQVNKSKEISYMNIDL